MTIKQTPLNNRLSRNSLSLNIFSFINKLHLHWLDFEFKTSSSALLLQGKEVSFELELKAE